MGSNNRIVSLQILRAIAFLMIFFFHTDIGRFGPFAVSIFFILSGFVMIYSKKNYNERITFKNSFKFSTDKIKKLYILHIIAMLVCVVLILNVDKYQDPINIVKKILYNLFLVQSLVPDNTIYLSLNGVAWYLSAVLFVYMFYPLVSRYLNKKTVKSIIGGMIGVFLIQVISLTILVLANIKIPFSNDFPKWFTYIFPLYRLGDFFIGCSLGYLYKNNKINISRIKAIVLEITCLICIVIINLIYDNAGTYLLDDRFKYTIINLPSALTLVALFATNKGLITRLLSKSKILLKIGNLSGYLFLIHQVVIKLVNNLLVTFDEIHLNTYFVVIVELLLSYLFAWLYSNISRKNNNIESGC